VLVRFIPPSRTIILSQKGRARYVGLHDRAKLTLRPSIRRVAEVAVAAFLQGGAVMRSKSKSRPQKLRVSYRGCVHDHPEAVDTFEAVICEIVRDKSLAAVLALGIRLSGELLVQIGGSTARQSRDCGTFHLATHSDTDEKSRVLRQLQRAFSLDMEVLVLTPAEQTAEAIELLG